MSINQIILDHITNEEVENKVVKGLNKAIDIPFINEKSEEKIARAVWQVVKDVLRKVLNA
tara:strand:- start:508 stop:687 length:180 start_codon:yes stop_codon:yes gene_type:complete